MVRKQGTQPCTIVIKLGTSSIVHETTHQPLLSRLAAIVETVLALKHAGHKVVLVSSGAIGVGLRTINMEARPKNLSGVQALAAIGQGRLIALWDNLFGHFGQSIAQILLTRGDIADVRALRTRYLNAVNTLTELLTMGVVPIVNENDTISVSEIKFGDNDTLSAITASMLHADFLFLLTDVDGLYTTNPRKDPTARPIDVVDSVQAIRAQVSTKTLGSKLGTGGMETKLIAAEIAAAAGVATVISHSLHPERILDIIEYNGHLRRSRGSVTPRELRETVIEKDNLDHTEAGTQGVNVEDPSSHHPPFSSGSSSSTALTRPPHTLFIPSDIPLRDLKSWTSHTLAPAGSIVIDAGAHRVLSRRESGGRLLAAGVIAVEGTFASGQAVRILVRRGDSSSEYVHGFETPVSPMGAMTPTSVSDVLQQVSTLSVTEPTVDERLVDADMDPDVTPMVAPKDLDGEEHSVEPTPTPALDVIEVGRGLANYNSAQIARVKGMKSSNISHVLGYADSEYVVENITIRVSPSALIESH